VNDQPLTHVDEQGRAHMVDVSGKPVTRRRALAHAVVRLSAGVMVRIRGGAVEKGEVLAVARVAGITAAKETSRLIPLCHPLSLGRVAISFRDVGEESLEVLAEVEAEGKTGVEMEALTAAAVAALTVYDMVKATCRGASITDLELLEKEGGRSGAWRKPGSREVRTQP
jgi:cyclic pyranopterin phosphate synthase